MRPYEMSNMHKVGFFMEGHASVHLLTKVLIEIRLSGVSKMASVRRNTVVWFMIILSLGFYLHTPFPEEAAEPWKQRMTSASVRLVSDLSYLGQKIGIASAVNITRVLTGHIQYVNAASLQAEAINTVQVSEDVFGGVKVRIYKPTGTEGMVPGIVHIHGGGWALLSVDAYDAFTMELALKSKAVVLAVEYRLSPEHPFPIPLDDCVTATKYFMEHADKYGVDRSRIAVIGDSAGGNLAMAVSLKMSQETKYPKLKAQALIYPALQAMDFNLPSYQTYSEQKRKCPSFATKEVLIAYWQLYAFGDIPYTSDFFVNNHTSAALKHSKYAEYISHKHLPQKYHLTESDPSFENAENGHTASKIESIITNPLYAPLMASDEELRKLPNTYVMTAEYDALRDDGWILADRLQNLNLNFKHTHYDGYEHGFGLMLHYDIHGKFINNIVDYFDHNL